MSVARDGGLLFAGAMLVVLFASGCGAARSSRDTEADAVLERQPAGGGISGGSTDQEVVAERAPARNDDAPVTGEVLLTVGRHPVQKEELADVFLYFFRPQYYEAVGYLVERTLVDEEARRLEVEIDLGILDPEVDGELQRQREEIRIQLGADLSFEEFIRDNFKIGVSGYRSLLGSIVRTKLLRDRVIRFSALRQGTADCRRIVVEDEALALEIRGKAVEGADFATLARKHSVTASAREGGLLRDLRPGFLEPELDAALSSLAPGEVSEIVLLENRNGTLYHLLLLVRRREGRPISWSRAKAEVEQEIEERPVEPLEVLQWNRVLEREYPVVYRSEQDGTKP